MTSHAENIQNKYAISLQHHKKEMSDEVNFLHADKHRSFLQTNTIFFGGLLGMPKVPRQVCNIFVISQDRS